VALIPLTLSIYDTREAMNASSLESWDDEFSIAGLASCQNVNHPAGDTDHNALTSQFRMG
jgi:hypothetical protein